MRTTCACRNGHDRLRIAGVPLDPMSRGELLAHYQRFLACEETHVVNHLAAHPFVLAKDDDGFCASLASADLNLPDGMGVVWGARVLGATGVRTRLDGPTSMLDVMRWGLIRGLRHSLVGASPETLDALERNLTRGIRGVRVVGVHSPPVREITHAGVEADLRAVGSRADILWVGLSTPKQQRWAEIARRHHPAKVIVTVGAAFDFHAGAKAHAPEWIQRSGMEWAFRLAHEPTRLWRRYLIGNPRFAWTVLSERVARGSRRAA